VTSPSTARDTRGRSVLARVWFGALLASICFEGLGRKILPQSAYVALYFLKDCLVLSGLAVIGVRRDVWTFGTRLLGMYRVVVIAAIGWTLIEVFNPSQAHLGLALIGLKSYWLWWMAPLVVASALRTAADRGAALRILIGVTAVVVAYAVVQFASPAQAAVNAYAVYDLDSAPSVAIVSTTGRPRVASTFSYISGFTAFLTFAPPLLLAFGLGVRAHATRFAATAAAAIAAASIPMSGSRAPLILTAMGVGLVGFGTGFIATRLGRRALVGVAAAAAVTLFAMPIAVEGVRDRFRGDDTTDRLIRSLEVLPPVALVWNDYPLLGEGTGMQQNARLAFGVSNPWNTEAEAGRVLVELGPFGYLLLWTTRLGLAVALLRAAWILRRCGRRPIAGGAFAFAFFAIVSNLAFDHVWQALFFVGVGLILSEATSLGREPAGPDVAQGVL
jgi:hypothetical protein